MSKTAYRNGIILAIVLHLLTLFLFAADIIPQQTKATHQGFYWFHQGGDETGYYDQMLNIRTGEFEANKFPLGFPILMLPFSWVIGPEFTPLVQPIAFFWSAIMLSIALVMLADLTLKLTGSRLTAVLSALIWAVLPLLCFIGFNIVWNAEMAEIIAIHLTWAQMLSDGPTAFFTLLAVWWMVRTDTNSYQARDVAILGALLGFIGMMRFTGLLIAFVIGGLFLLKKQWRMIVLLVLVALIFFAPQMIYNLHFFGGPFSTGYTELDVLPEHGLFNIIYLTDAIGKVWARIGILTVLAAIGGIAVFGMALWRLWRQNWFYAVLIGGWIGSYLALYGIYYYSWHGGLMRFMIPVVPAFALLGAVLVAWIIKRIWRFN